MVQGELIVFDGSGSYGDSPIVGYEWDFDYDGIIFDTEFEGAVVEQFLCEPGVRDVALRITDDQMSSEICTVEAEIYPDDTPTDGWSTDRMLVDDVTGPFILNISHRAIHDRGNSHSSRGSSDTSPLLGKYHSKVKNRPMAVEIESQRQSSRGALSFCLISCITGDLRTTKHSGANGKTKKDHFINIPSPRLMPKSNE